MNTLETRLADKQATLAHITRHIHRHLQQGTLSRLELRYSTQAKEKLLPHQAKEAIANLLRQHGQGAAAVSVRAHDGPIDDATGEHLVRLIWAQPARQGDQPTPMPSVPAASPPGLGGRLLRWLLRWLPGHRPQPAATPNALAAKAPAIGGPAAVKLLREAVQVATGYLETDTGAALAGPGLPAGHAVARARVVVRLAALHDVLAPMLPHHSAAAAASLARMVADKGLAVASDFSVSYAFKPRDLGDSTGYASDSDVQVQLVASSQPAQAHTKPRNTPDRIEPTLVPQPRTSAGGTLLPSPANAGGTALPTPAQQPPAMVIRVLGTLDENFAQPFDITFAQWPARFDRQALQRAGFGHQHPALLAVASNSCPLVVTGQQPGDLRIQAGGRTQAGAAQAAMYFDRQTLQPLLGELALPAGPIVVNHPGGVVDPASGHRLPALVIQLLPGTASTQWPMAA